MLARGFFVLAPFSAHLTSMIGRGSLWTAITAAVCGALVTKREAAFGLPHPIWGMELLWLDMALLFTRADSRPGAREQGVCESSNAANCVISKKMKRTKEARR
jgi:hypothetical protein